MKFLYTDDKTKAFSDTTLRTWLLFFLFFFTALAMIVIELVSPGSVTERAIVLLDVAAVAAGGGGALYLGKRVNERNMRHISVGDVTVSEPVTGARKPDRMGGHVHEGVVTGGAP